MSSITEMYFDRTLMKKVGLANAKQNTTAKYGESLRMSERESQNMRNVAAELTKFESSAADGDSDELL